MTGSDISVRVKFFNIVRDKAGTEEEVFFLSRGSTLSHLLEIMRSRYGRDFTNYCFDSAGNLRLHIQLVGVKDSTPMAADKILSDGEELFLLAALSGG